MEGLEYAYQYLVENIELSDSRCPVAHLPRPDLALDPPPSF